MAAGWHVAVFQRSKKMPELKKVLSGAATQRRQSPEENKAVMRAIFAKRRGSQKPR